MTFKPRGQLPGPLFFETSETTKKYCGAGARSSIAIPRFPPLEGCRVIFSSGGTSRGPVPKDVLQKYFCPTINSLEEIWDAVNRT